MSGPPRTWRRTQASTPLGRDRLRQPFRSPLLANRTGASPATSTSTTNSTSPVPASKTNSASPAPASASVPFRFPLLTGTPSRVETSTSGGVYSPAGDSPLTGDSAASPVLRDTPRVGAVAGSDSVSESPSVDGADVSSLAAALAAADGELARLEAAGCRTEQLPLYIDALHGYNEIKDAAQLVMGRIAELDGVTVRSVHQRYECLPPAERQ